MFRRRNVAERTRAEGAIQGEEPQNATIEITTIILRRIAKDVPESPKLMPTIEGTIVVTSDYGCTLFLTTIMKLEIGKLGGFGRCTMIAKLYGIRYTSHKLIVQSC